MGIISFRDVDTEKRENLQVETLNTQTLKSCRESLARISVKQLLQYTGQQEQNEK